MSDECEIHINELLRRAAQRRARRLARKRKCGARTRMGTPCQALGRGRGGRCKLHGGKSTGPRTPEGRARIAEAMRRRWADLRTVRAG
jgi:hypothetical protein